ncbi:hypothetical protein XA26_01380 [Mycolicibacterium fortuitum]|uniref:Uncharacterized protein n=1 Tax=Mycolicibacterium fortuitum TaxID=1766 RepID=A0A0N9X6J6_MYCFO|nr:hypothetical protein XA26_01380 [Mycolicibacterium fortuitum]
MCALPQTERVEPGEHVECRVYQCYGMAECPGDVGVGETGERQQAYPHVSYLAG